MNAEPRTCVVDGGMLEAPVVDIARRSRLHNLPQVRIRLAKLLRALSRSPCNNLPDFVEFACKSLGNDGILSVINQFDGPMIEFGDGLRFHHGA